MAFEHKALGYTFKFKDLTWKEELGVEVNKDFLARSLFEVSGKPVSQAEAEKILELFPEKAIQALFLIYQANLPQDRTWSAKVPFFPPSPGGKDE